MKYYDLSISILSLLIASCGAEGSNDANKNVGIESKIIYPNAGNYTLKQASGMRSIAELRCNSQDQSSCVDLARMLKSGFGGEKDEERASIILKGACKNNFKIACDELKK